MENFLFNLNALISEYNTKRQDQIKTIKLGIDCLNPSFKKIDGSDVFKRVDVKIKMD